MLLYAIQQARATLTADGSLYVILVLILSLVVIAVGLLWTAPSFTTRRQLRNLRHVKPSKRNTDDQHDAKYAVPEGSPTQGPVRTKAICIHPVKSCGPVELDRAMVTKAGLLLDRCFSFAVDSDGKRSDDALALGYLGMHAVPEDRDLNAAREQRANLVVCVGDEIEVLERGYHLYGFTGDLYYYYRLYK